MENLKINRIKKIISYITVEPALFAIAIPYSLSIICLENLTLEKACRVNLGFPDLVCDNMMDKALNNINCGDVSDRQKSLSTAQDNLVKSNATIFANDNGTLISSDWNINWDFNSTSHHFEMEVCRAERESQKLGSTISGYIAPFESIICIILVLYAGNWSDRTGRRKPCILIPQIGDFLYQFVALIAAIFMKQLPAEFNTILGTLLSALGGGWTLTLIGIFSYLTEITDEKDRVFRFAVLYQISPIISICTLPFSGILYQKLGYIKLISMCLLINFLGVLYIVFVIKEIRPRAEAETGKELAVMLPEVTSQENGDIEKSAVNVGVTNTSGNLFSNVVKDCFTLIARKRSGNGRKIVCLILVFVGLSEALDYDYVNEYYFVRTKLNWEALEEAPFAAYSSTIYFIGTTFMTYVMSKYFKISDTLLALVSSSFTTLSKIICITVTTTFMLYVGKAFDMFCGFKNLVVRSVISSVVDNNEIGKIYSVIGVLENVGRSIFIPIYTNIYKYTVDTFPNAYFICSLVLAIVLTILSGVLHRWVVAKKRTSKELSNSQPMIASTDREDKLAEP